MSARTAVDLEAELASVLIDLGPTVVALSGGVDSSLLAVAAHRSHGDDMVAVTAVSASLASGELDHCRDLARQFGFRWQSVDTKELGNERYRVNDPNRCYWCKSALMDELEPMARCRSATVTLGVNLDDLGDHRPGQQASAERGAVFPLVEAEFTKADVRTLARHWRLPVWDRPAMPCLSSRIPYGTAVSVPLLSRIDRAESALRKLGFDDVRVRHYDETARIELPIDRLTEAAERASTMVEAVQNCGYRYVTLDLAGLRSGNLNHTI